MWTGKDVGNVQVEKNDHKFEGTALLSHRDELVWPTMTVYLRYHDHYVNCGE